MERAHINFFISFEQIQRRNQEMQSGANADREFAPADEGREDHVGGGQLPVLQAQSPSAENRGRRIALMAGSVGLGSPRDAGLERAGTSFQNFVQMQRVDASDLRAALEEMSEVESEDMEAEDTQPDNPEIDHS